MWSQISSALRIVRWHRFRIGAGPCPLCGTSVFLKLDDDPVAVRCVRCGSSAVTLSHIAVLEKLPLDLGRSHVYELSSRGRLFEYLRREAGELTYSEFFEDVPAGVSRDGVTCQDVERLTYPDASFDLCTSTEVFEHVADDRRGFAEVARVLKPGGWFVFTVPLTRSDQTVERVRRTEGGLEYLLPPEYHDDRITGPETVLVFRDYGADICGRLEQAGFASAELREPSLRIPWPLTRPVVVARR